MHGGLTLVKDAATGHSQSNLERLGSTFERKRTSIKLFLLKKMLILKFIEGDEPMENFLICFDDIVRETKVAGCKIEEMVACLLLLALPDSYNVVVTAIKTLSDNKINVDFVRRCLLDEVAKGNRLLLSLMYRKTRVWVWLHLVK